MALRTRANDQPTAPTAPTSMIEKLGTLLFLGIGAIVVVCAVALIGAMFVLGDTAFVFGGE